MFKALQHHVREARTARQAPQNKSRQAVNCTHVYEENVSFNPHVLSLTASYSEGTLLLARQTQRPGTSYGAKKEFLKKRRKESHSDRHCESDRKKKKNNNNNKKGEGEKDKKQRHVERTKERKKKK